MAARTKPLKVVEPTSPQTYAATVGYDLPAAKGGVKLIPVEQADQLINILHNEAKVI